MAQTLTLETYRHPLRDPSLEPAHCFQPVLFAADADPTDELEEEDEEDEEDDDEDDEDEEELDQDDDEEIGRASCRERV